MSSAGIGPSLGGLPDELLIQILESLPSQRDLWAVCLASRRLNSVADPVLHKSILFDQPKHHLTFSESLTTRPRRGSLIHNVRLDYPSSELSWLKESTNRIDNYSLAISTMSNLEKLVVSVPESLSRGIGIVFNGPFDLPSLKTCKFGPSGVQHDLLRGSQLLLFILTISQAPCITRLKMTGTGIFKRISTSSATLLWKF